MDMRTVVDLVRRDLRAALVDAPNIETRLATLRPMVAEYDAALVWLKKTVAVAIADEKRLEKMGSPELAQQRTAVDQLKQALRVLNQKRADLQGMIEVVAGQRGSTRTPRVIEPLEPAPLPLEGQVDAGQPASTSAPRVIEAAPSPLEVEVDAGPRYVQSRQHAPPLLLTVSGPPGGMDGLQVWEAPQFLPGHEGVRSLWARTDPAAHALLQDGALALEQGTIRIGAQEWPALAFVRPFMRPRHCATLVTVVPAGTRAAVVCRKIESPSTVPWEKFASCPLLRSLKVR